MDNKKSKATRAGETIKETSWLITLVFISLRADDVITWPWYRLISPIIISWLAAGVILAIAGLITAYVFKTADTK
jgi:hypothetical protein